MNRNMVEPPRRSLLARMSATGLIVGIAVGSIVGIAGAVVPGSAAEATEATSSAVTVSNRDYALNPDESPFPELQVTVSQTRDLVSQGIQISWTGAAKSTRPIGGSMGGENFLQIAQCWGEDPEHPGHPDRTTCVYGGSNAEGTTRDSSIDDKDVPAADHPDAQYTVPRTGTFSNAYTAIPFRPADGSAEVSAVAWSEELGRNARVDGVNMNTNPYFTSLNTNEVRWAGSGSDGSGSVPFEVQTSQQSNALGCGAPIAVDGATVGQSCWLVIIPRGTGDSGQQSIVRPGLFWDAWEHHLAVKLDFKPVGVRCEIGSAERQIAGSELITIALGSWQPKLCEGETGAAFVHSIRAESDALRDAAGTEASPLAMTSRPYSTEGADPIEYAPVALSGPVITFGIDRRINSSAEVPQEYADLDRLPFESVKLTPRLVAKLLTASYVEALPPGTDRSHIGFTGDYNDPASNPRTITRDPDFLEINDAEWGYQNLVKISLGDALTPSGRSDMITQLWRYVLADPGAAAWLAGEPDPWGMTVNPWYSTNPEVNPVGVGLTLPTDNFPKADPVTKPDTTAEDPINGSGEVNLVTWRAYTHDFEAGAHDVLRGDGLLLGGWDRLAVPAKFAKGGRDLIGERGVIAVSTAPASSRYQTVNASLLNPAGQFVSPSTESLLAGAAAMNPTSGQPKVLDYDPASEKAKGAASAYPLTMPVYAALNPLQEDAGLRAIYANLIRYAVNDGQTSGTEVGQLPAGYAPIPDSWKAQALDAATGIEQGRDPNARPQTTGGSTTGAGTPNTNWGGTSFPLNSGATPGSGADPSATGTAAGALTGAPTPEDPKTGPIVAAVPAGLVSGLAAALAVPFFGRIRRLF